MSQAEWGVLGTKWAFENPAGMNPIEDTTGEFSFLGDQGPVFFLGGTFGGATVTRSVTIRDDQYIFLGLLNETLVIPLHGETETELRAGTSASVGLIDQLFLEIDGVAPAGVDLFDHRQPSPPGLFDLVLPENNVVDAPAGTYPAVKDGYDVMLEPLSQGNHTLAFGGRFSDPDPENIFTSSVIYSVTVVPEPSSFILGL